MTRTRSGEASFFWHDYETWGVNPRRDRPVQFAGIRTDSEFNIIDEPVEIFARPTMDILPHPEACLVTGITPGVALEKGISEYEFSEKILSEFSRPNTCSVGYNSIRFDDEVSRFLFYRNLRDPYAREWQNACTRWDLIDLVRACYALRPDGIEWPVLDEVPVFRLEELSKANGLLHDKAHDALSDVTATIALARLIREKQPRLFEHAFALRKKENAWRWIDLENRKPFVHVSGKIAARRGCLGIMMPLVMDATNKNALICYDLVREPDELWQLTADEIVDRVFTPQAELPEDIERIPLKVVHMNRSPFVAPLSVLKGVDSKRIGLDPEKALQHAGAFEGRDDINDKLQAVFSTPGHHGQVDVDFDLYGGFLQGHDKNLLNELHKGVPGSLMHVPVFQDDRLAELVFRFKARNFPESLSETEAGEWRHTVSRLLSDPDRIGANFDEYKHLLDVYRQSMTGQPSVMEILQNLESWWYTVKTWLEAKN